MESTANVSFQGNKKNACKVVLAFCCLREQGRCVKMAALDSSDFLERVAFCDIIKRWNGEKCVIIEMNAENRRLIWGNSLQ